MNEKLDAITERLDQLHFTEKADLASMLQEQWGVKSSFTSQADQPLPPPPVNVKMEQTEFTATLVEAAPATKINVIKAVRELTGLGLKEAKDFVDGVPRVLKEGISKAEADAIVVQFEKAGGKVTLS